MSDRSSPFIVTRRDRVVVHGMTGRQGTFWTARMRDYGTNVVAGVSPAKGGSRHLGLPVFTSAVEAAAAGSRGDDSEDGTHSSPASHRTGIDVSVLFVPPAGARAAVADAAQVGARLVVVLTEFIPVADTMAMVAEARAAGTAIIGPNTAGIVNPGETFVGFMPAFDPRIFTPGSIGVVSRSGSLGTLAAVELTRAGYGQSAFLGIGGDPVSGTSTAQAVQALEDDDRTEAIVVIGEIGGRKEEEAAAAVAAGDKPVVAFVAGFASPPGRRMGHAGAIVEGSTGTHESKHRALTEAGATVVATPWELPGALADLGVARSHPTPTPTP